MTPDAGTVLYDARKKQADQEEISDSITVSSALDWLAAVVTHIPNKGQQLSGTMAGIRTSLRPARSEPR
jgi:hypothetical protein